MKVKITPRARDNLRSIGAYSMRKWGKAQTGVYLRSLSSRFDWLAEHPKLGKARPDIGEGYHCFRQGEHLIFYMIFDDHIAIIGLPHISMDIDNHFG